MAMKTNKKLLAKRNYKLNPKGNKELLTKGHVVWLYMKFTLQKGFNHYKVSSKKTDQSLLHTNKMCCKDIYI
jgi:hypothetical protein